MDVGPEKQPPPQAMVKGQEVSLGCGTLILIAVIVMFFSNNSRHDRAALAPVLKKLEAIEQKLDALETRMEAKTLIDAK
jgi:hypothetical protein